MTVALGVQTAGASVMAGCDSTGRGRLDASGLPVDRPVREADLVRQPEAHLYYPGSDRVRNIGADQTPARPGEEPNPAYLGAILAVAATPAQLYQWYGQQLGPRGFVPTADYRPSTQVSGEAWQFDRRLQVQVGIFDLQRLEADQGIRVREPDGTLVYEVVLVGYAPGLPRSGG
ncbi:MAG TPA: hypothetical protein VFH70_12715 [Acidimicrobiales bacterium]|nr:hypothetical protein [Acidimicrobiales bacterium]